MPITTATAGRHVKGSGGRKAECGEWSFFPRADGAPLSHTFTVHQEPVVIVAACLGPDHYVQLQTTPDEGANWVDVCVLDQPVRLTAIRTLLYLPLSGRYRLCYVGTPIGRVTGRLHTLTHEAFLPLVPNPPPVDLSGYATTDDLADYALKDDIPVVPPPLDLSGYLTKTEAQTVYLAKQYDTANDLTIKDTLDDPAYSRLVISSTTLRGELYPAGHGASGIEMRNGPGSLLRFQMAYSDITWALHCYGNDGVVRLPDAVQFDRNSQDVTFWGDLSVVGPKMSARRGLAQVDVWHDGQAATILNDCTGGATVRQIVTGTQVNMDFMSLKFAVKPPFVPNDPPDYTGPGPDVAFRHADAAGTLHDRLVFKGTGVFLPNLPTVDPHVVGQVWNSAGALHISAG
jgi:hypothetical protein